MKKRFFSYLVVAVVSLAYLKQSSTTMGNDHDSKAEEPVGPRVENLVGADPKQDFARARAKGDVYFLAVRGLTLMVPGVKRSQQHLVRQVGRRIIQGTSDVVPDERARKLRQNALEYAERYNQLVVKFLIQQDANAAAR